MNEKNLFEDIEQIWKCPNCDEESFLIEKWFCTNCNYWKEYNEIKKQTNSELSENLEPIKKNFIFKDSKLESYKISILENKINEIKFKFWKYRFLIWLKYNVNQKTFKDINFYETEKDEREKIFKKIDISWLKILYIFRKVKNWYWEKKDYVNYFKFLWLDNNQVYNFTKKLLLEFHSK